MFPFQGNSLLRIVRLVDDHIGEYASRELLVQLRCREVHVARYQLPPSWIMISAEDVLGGPPLVGGNDVLVTE